MVRRRNERPAMTSLKTRLTQGESPLGVLLRMPAETLVDLAGVGGLDFVLIDCEHGPADLLALRAHIDAATVHGAEVLVRVGRNDSDLILRALDLGASGIVVPHVDDAAAARRVVHDAHYPPLGDRGFAQYSRVGRYGAISAHDQLADARANTLVIVMIETQQGVDNAEFILAVEGVDAVMAGPADLSVSLGLTGGVDEPAVQVAVDHVTSEARKAGRHVLTIVGGPEKAVEAPPGLVAYNLAAVLLERFRHLAGARDSART